MIVIDEPGVMARITGMFARRGFNIDTITVGKTNDPNQSKIIFTCIADDKNIKQVERQCNKLIDVIKVREFNDNSILKETCIVKIKAIDDKTKEDIKNITEENNFKVIDKADGHVIVGLMTETEKIDIFLKEMEKFGILDISRTGITGISKE